MLLKRKVRLVQAASGAVILTLMMQPMGLLGYGSYIWMLFLPLLLFFALGADFKVIPSMILSYICGIIWAFINGLVQGMFGSFMPATASQAAAPIIVIFLILTVHENFLAKTIVGNIPALFMGMASTFFVFLVKPANAPAITPIHLIIFYLYGILLSVVLVAGGFKICSLIFGKDKTLAVFTGKEEKSA